MIRWMHGSVWKLLVIGPALWLTPPVGAQESVREELVQVEFFRAERPDHDKNAPKTIEYLVHEFAI